LKNLFKKSFYFVFLYKKFFFLYKNYVYPKTAGGCLQKRTFLDICYAKPICGFRSIEISNL